MKRALVTGGAGLIGSHVADLLVCQGWRVRILDNLEPNTHKLGKPVWINREAEFVHGDLRDREAIEDALSDIDMIFHQAAYGGYMPEMAKYVHVNSLGTAQMLEVIREKDYRGEFAGGLQRRRGSVPKARPRFSKGAAGGTIAAR